MIFCENLTKWYPMIGLQRYVVFSGINLVIPEKINVGIVGPNGAGKTTLLKLLSGVDLPSAGSVRLSNEVLVSPPLGIASGLSPSISGLNNAKFVSRINGDSPEMMDERVEFIRRFSDIGDFFNRPVMFYSSGMRARLNFAIAMAFDYDYYLIDELTSVGDKSFRTKASKTFREKLGKAAILLVSHNLEALVDETQSGIYVSNGNVIWHDDIRDAIKQYEDEMPAEAELCR